MLDAGEWASEKLEQFQTWVQAILDKIDAALDKAKYRELWTPYAQKVQRAQASFDTAERREDQRRLCASSGKGPTIVKLNGLSKCGLRFDL